MKERRERGRKEENQSWVLKGKVTERVKERWSQEYLIMPSSL